MGTIGLRRSLRLIVAVAVAVSVERVLLVGLVFTLVFVIGTRIGVAAFASAGTAQMLLSGLFQGGIVYEPS
ncbi:MAG: hypothetical protein JNK12_20265 [Acidimicrobiales bacterium]|nr:hypothetical protein [Acidimicrobiales bacterium]